MSHGGDGYVYGTDARIYIEEIIDIVKGTISLAGKPKIVIIQVIIIEYVLSRSIWTLFEARSRNMPILTVFVNLYLVKQIINEFKLVKN